MWKCLQTSFMLLLNTYSVAFLCEGNAFEFVLDFCFKLGLPFHYIVSCISKITCAGFFHSKFCSNWYVFIIGITTVLNVIIFLLETRIFFVNLGNSKAIESVRLIIHKIIL